MTEGRDGDNTHASLSQETFGELSGQPEKELKTASVRISNQG